MEVSKIIFLDFDGVITTDKSDYRLDARKLALLGRIIDATDCSLVISSSWRSISVQTTIESLSDSMDYFNNGIVFPFCNRIVGVTDILAQQSRGDEIAKWIADKGFSGQYIILDDINDFLEEQLPHFVKTDGKKGLSNADAEKTITLLNNIVCN
jgi:hypothetical protein